jgi:hypothetical protein
VVAVGEERVDAPGHGRGHGLVAGQRRLAAMICGDRADPRIRRSMGARRRRGVGGIEAAERARAMRASPGDNVMVVVMMVMAGAMMLGDTGVAVVSAAGMIVIGGMPRHVVVAMADGTVTAMIAVIASSSTSAPRKRQAGVETGRDGRHRCYEQQRGNPSREMASIDHIDLVTRGLRDGKVAPAEADWWRFAKPSVSNS